MKALRVVPDSRALYLTFDDGPDPFSTEPVLEVLKKHEVLATFFVIAEKAVQYPEVFKKILDQGHSIGNHSLNHRYRPFFKGRTSMLDWVDQSEEVFRKICPKPTVGFRPPAGIVNPKLLWALKQRQIPLILWKVRFFDTLFPWNSKTASQSLQKIQNGSIILLHDRQNERKLPGFLRTLESYLLTARQKGFEFRPLTRVIRENFLE